MYGLIALIGIVIWIFLVAYDDTKQEQERLKREAQEEYRKMIYSWFNECKWCNKEYQIKDGSEYFCSPKCEHQHDKARNK